jgi:hypothetical protein
MFECKYDRVNIDAFVGWGGSAISVQQKSPTLKVVVCESLRFIASLLGAFQLRW